MTDPISLAPPFRCWPPPTSFRVPQVPRCRHCHKEYEPDEGMSHTICGDCLLLGHFDHNGCRKCAQNRDAKLARLKAAGEGDDAPQG